MSVTAERPRVDLSTRLMTKEEVAELLRVRPTTVAELARRTGGVAFRPVRARHGLDPPNRLVGADVGLSFERVHEDDRAAI